MAEIIGNVVVGFYIVHDSVMGNSIGNIDAWSKSKGFDFRKTYLLGKPSEGTFVGIKLYDITNDPHPWFTSVKELRNLISKAELKISNIQPNMRVELLVDQWQTRTGVTSRIASDDIGDVVVGFYVPYDFAAGKSIHRMYPSLSKSDALAKWSNDNKFNYCEEYLSGDPLMGSFVGIKLWEITDNPNPWFVTLVESLHQIAQANYRVSKCLSNRSIFDNDLHARPEFLVNQWSVRSC